MPSTDWTLSTMSRPSSSASPVRVTAMTSYGPLSVDTEMTPSKPADCRGYAGGLAYLGLDQDVGLKHADLPSLLRLPLACPPAGRTPEDRNSLG